MMDQTRSSYGIVPKLLFETRYWLEPLYAIRWSQSSIGQILFEPPLSTNGKDRLLLISEIRNKLGRGRRTVCTSVRGKSRLDAQTRVPSCDFTELRESKNIQATRIILRARVQKTSRSTTAHCPDNPAIQARYSSLGDPVR